MTSFVVLPPAVVQIHPLSRLALLPSFTTTSIPLTHSVTLAGSNATPAQPCPTSWQGCEPCYFDYPLKP